MSWFSKRTRPPDVYFNDVAFDSWDVVRDFEDLATAKAWKQQLIDAGIEAVLTSDWPLDHQRGDIALRVRPERWSDAEELLSGLSEIE